METINIDDWKKVGVYSEEEAKGWRDNAEKVLAKFKRGDTGDVDASEDVIMQTIEHLEKNYFPKLIKLEKNLVKERKFFEKKKKEIVRYGEVLK